VPFLGKEKALIQPDLYKFFIKVRHKERQYDKRRLKDEPAW
jgi:hypothetical protein